MDSKSRGAPAYEPLAFDVDFQRPSNRKGRQQTHFAGLLKERTGIVDPHSLFDIQVSGFTSTSAST
jgi:hypothetical protein